jgi:hypothetical protein
MSTSKRIILECIGAYLDGENTEEKRQTFADKIKPYLGEYAQRFTSFVTTYRGLYSYKTIPPMKLYLAAVCSISSCITQKVMQQSQPKQRIPMLPELQSFIENSGYSFTLLRATSYLCEVQISAK